MEESSLRDESLLFQWNFFERTISNYSIIIKMFQHMEGEKDLFASMPRVFVEETIFDMCELVSRGEEDRSFFGIHGALRSIECEALEKVKGTIFSPSVYQNIFGYGTLYVYPLRRNISVFGYLILGKKKAVQLEASVLRDLDLLCEILNRFILLNMNINELKMTEDVKARQLDSRLATTKTLLENIIDQFPDALFLVDRNGAICFANTKGREEFFEGKALVGVEKIEDLFSGIEKGFLEKDFVLRGEMHYRKGEDYKLYTLESYPIKDEEGKVVFKSLVLKDVADERIEEEENIYRNKMESIGKLAGGIAHDFNNVLTGILGYASLVKRMTPQEGQLNRYAEVIESSAKRAATLTEHLLNFSRRQRTKKVDNIDLNALLGDILFLVKQSFRNITIQKEFDKELPLLKGDAGELQHAFLNLCINAKDAMPEGGTLTIRTRRKAYIGDREFAVVTVEDTGSGIDEELRNKVFEPFFTTKTENNKKLGMGLYLVQKVVRSYGGFIELKSGRDKGTVFTLYFPFTAEQKERPRKQVAPKRDPKKNRILVVDDEKVVRELITGILSAEGFEVLQAKDGPDAIALLKAQSQPVDLVILDMIMPGMDGEEVLQKLREISKTLKVVISSGFMSEEQRDKLKEHDIDDFLDKPYRDTDAITVVKAVLSRPALISE